MIAPRRDRCSRSRVLITNAEQRAVLAASRGLDAAGFLVGATAEDRGAPGLWSRSCAEAFADAPPLVDGPGVVDFLGRIVATGRYGVLLAGTDETLFAISKHRDRLEGAVELALPDHDVVERAFDRTALAAAAARAGLDSVRSEVCATREDARAASARLGYPVLIKPVRAVRETDGRIERWPSRRADDERTFEDSLASFRWPLIVERCEAGRVVSLGGVVAGGRLLGVVFSRYVRTWPPDAGSAAFSRTADPPPGLVDAVGTLLAEMGWEGLFELEMIERPDGALLPIDFNPRVYGSLALSLGASVNLPAIWVRWVLGEPPEAPALAPAGIHYRCEDIDLRHRLWLARSGRLGQARAALRPRPPTVGAYLRLDDPAPLLARALELSVAAGRKARRGLAR